MRDTVLIIPCYNESQRLRVNEFEEFAWQCDDVRFLFVNDGSTDGTQDLLEALARSNPDAFQVKRLERNSGKAEAVRQGMLEALESHSTYAGYWDADLATPLDAIPEFRDVLKANPQFELVIGSRVRLLGRNILRNPRRHYLGRIFATLASLALGLGIYDTQCGAKLFRVSSTVQTLFEEPFRSSWIFDVEILARMIRQRRDATLARVENVLYELPLQRWCDIDGSKVKGHDFVNAPLELLSIYWAYLRPGTGRPESGTTRASNPIIPIEDLLQAPSNAD